jgi:hypothetical protein
MGDIRPADGNGSLRGTQAMGTKPMRKGEYQPGQWRASCRVNATWGSARASWSARVLPRFLWEGHGFPRIPRISFAPPDRRLQRRGAHAQAQSREGREGERRTVGGEPEHGPVVANSLRGCDDLGRPPRGILLPFFRWLRASTGERIIRRRFLRTRRSGDAEEVHNQGCQGCLGFTAESDARSSTSSCCVLAPRREGASLRADPFDAVAR